MNAALTLVSDQDAALAYLTEARKHHTQAAIAKHLGVGVRTISRWEARQTNPPAYLAHALQQLLPFGEESPAGAFDFILKTAVDLIPSPHFRATGSSVEARYTRERA